jgi:hypothetical protein
MRDGRTRSDFGGVVESRRGSVSFETVRGVAGSMTKRRTPEFSEDERRSVEIHFWIEKHSVEEPLSFWSWAAHL